MNVAPVVKKNWIWLIPAGSYPKLGMLGITFITYTTTAHHNYMVHGLQTAVCIRQFVALISGSFSGCFSMASTGEKQHSAPECGFTFVFPALVTRTTLRLSLLWCLFRSCNVC
jgi:hypothetical protein